MSGTGLDVMPSSPCFSAHPLQIARPPLPQCRVCVIVPVRNEAEVLEASLVALAHQLDLKGCPLDPTQYEIILFANNCTDDSAVIARRFAQRHPALMLHVVEQTLPAVEAYIGRVRQLLMDTAYTRLMAIGHPRGVIASTDADTRVAPTWIAATLQEIAQGADAVGGRIMTDGPGRAALDAHARAYFLRCVGYHFLLAELEAFLDPDPFDRYPRHHQHFGASLAVTAEMYARAGRMPAVRTPEDVAFYRALLRTGARFRHSPLVRVTTSARSVGRTDIGLANQLNQWATMGQRQQPFLVEPVAAVETRLHARRQLRNLWRRRLEGYGISEAIVPLAKQLQISPDWLWTELAQAVTVGALWEQIEQRQHQEGLWQQHWGLERIEQAIADLRLRLYKLRHTAVVYAAPERFRSLMSSKPARIHRGDTLPPANRSDVAG